jgi:hypothetical protein
MEAVMMRWVAAVAFSTLLANEAAATDASGRYFIMGPGKSACAEFVGAKAKGTDHLYASWVTGYLTAINQQSADTYSVTGNVTGDQIMKGLEDYCQKNPDRLFAVAAEALAQALAPQRLRSAPQ